MEYSPESKYLLTSEPKGNNPGLELSTDHMQVDT